MRIFKDANYDFLGWRRFGYIASGTALAIALIAAIAWQIGRGSWIDYGVDFTGGTLVQVEFPQAVPIAELRSLIHTGVTSAEVTEFGGQNEFLIRAQEFEEEGESTADEMAALLESGYGADGFNVIRTEAVGPKIGSELQQRAVIAILLSFVLTLIYLAIRFEWRFGVAAVIATVHDILITMGLISVFQLEVSLPTVAAVLTIIGYSLNDTIVVFDRVRENIKKVGRRVDYASLLTRSINETLPRTVMTSVTTVGALVALYLLGGAIIRDFALILIVGMVVGTYSSVFVASPALFEIQQRWGTRGGQTKKRQRTRARAAGAGV